MKGNKEGKKQDRYSPDTEYILPSSLVGFAAVGQDGAMILKLGSPILA